MHGRDARVAGIQRTVTRFVDSAVVQPSSSIAGSASLHKNYGVRALRSSQTLTVITLVRTKGR